MTYKVEIIRNNIQLEDFIHLPYSIYKNNLNWIAPLDSVVRSTLDEKSNPYFRSAKLNKFICYKNNEPVARAVSVINPAHWQKFGKKTAFFGFFESRNDKNAFQYLFDEIANSSRKNGAEYLEGPFNPNHYSELGLLKNEFDSEPRFFEPYNPEYYHNLLDSYDFKISYQVHTRINRDASAYLQQRYGEVQVPQQSGEFKIRTARLFDIKNELARMREVYNDAFSDNWHFLPVSEAEYKYSAKYLFFVTKPSFVIFIEKENETVGVLQCMLNINRLIKPLKGRLGFRDYLTFLLKRRVIPEVIIYAVGIKKEYQHTRTSKLILDCICRICRKYPVLSTRHLQYHDALE